MTSASDQQEQFAGEPQSPGTGPFFGEKTHFSGKVPPENMNLSSSRWDFAILLEQVEENSVLAVLAESFVVPPLVGCGVRSSAFRRLRRS
jgi:hypothetical protein